MIDLSTYDIRSSTACLPFRFFDSVFFWLSTGTSRPPHPYSMSEEVDISSIQPDINPPTEEPRLQRSCAGAQIRVGHCKNLWSSRLIVFTSDAFAHSTYVSRVISCLIFSIQNLCMVWFGRLALILLQPNSRVGLDEVEVDFMADQFSNVAHSVPGRVSAD